MIFKKKVTDPVCGMEIAVTKSTLHTDYQGKTIYFCSDDCLTKFETNPQQYVTAAADDQHQDESGHSHHDHSHHGHKHHH